MRVKRPTTAWFIIPMDKHTANSIGLELADMQKDNRVVIKFNGKDYNAFQLDKEDYHLVKILHDSAKEANFKFVVGRQRGEGNKIEKWPFTKKRSVRRTAAYKKAAKDLKGR